jgi:hypothetical protein
MISLDEDRNAMHRPPSLPFTVATAGGQSFLVRQPDFTANSPTGRMIAVSDPGGHPTLDGRLVTGTSSLPSPVEAE